MTQPDSVVSAAVALLDCCAPAGVTPQWLAQGVCMLDEHTIECKQCVYAWHTVPGPGQPVMCVVCLPSCRHCGTPALTLHYVLMSGHCSMAYLSPAVGACCILCAARLSDCHTQSTLPHDHSTPIPQSAITQAFASLHNGAVPSSAEPTVALQLPAVVPEEH